MTFSRGSRFLALALLCALLPGAALAGPSGVDLLATGPGVVRLGVTVPELTLEPAAGSDGAVKPRLDGWNLDGVPGSPGLPARIIHVAVPPQGAVTVRGFGSTQTVRDGVLLESIARANPASHGAATETGVLLARDPAIYASAASLAPERARLVGVSWLRNQRVATVAVFPVDYQPAARRLTSWGRVEIEVTVEERGVGATPAEPNDPFESVYRNVLVNYTQGLPWRRPAVAAGVGGFVKGGSQLLGTPTVVGTTSLLAGRTWVKLAITRSGFYRVTFSQLRTLAPFTDGAGVSFDSLYMVAWPGKTVLPENTYCDACDYREVATGIEDVGSDTKMNDNNDAIYFYALAASDWADAYDPTAADSIFISHPYDRANYYFITYDRRDAPWNETPFTTPPRRIATAGAPVSVGGGETVPTSFVTRQHLEVDSPSEYFPNLSPLYAPFDPSLYWDKFFWRSLQVDATLSQVVRLPGMDRTQRARIRVRSWGLNNRDDCVIVNPQHLMDVVVTQPGVGTVDSTRVGWFGVLPATARLYPVLDTLNTIKVSVPRIGGCAGRVDESVLSFIEVYYSRTLTPANDSLLIESPGNGNAIYRVGPFSSATPPRVFDVSDPFAPKELVGFDYAPSGPAFTLSFEVNESGPSRYALLRGTQFNKPLATDFTEANPTSLDNLRSTDHDADYLLVYYDGFKVAADSLLSWRRVRLPMDGNPGPYDVEGVPVSAIYDQFSGGRVDPTAIRNFLRATFYNWHRGGHAAPSYVTFLGDASFDFKNLLGLAAAGQPGSLIPSYENGFAGSQFASDDWLLNVDDPLTIIPDFFAGRIPAPDANVALDYVRRKILFYERSSPNGAYRNRVMLIADDDQQGEEDDPLHWKHLQQTAVLDTVWTPDHIDRSYVYLHTYPDGPGRTKPGAKADIKNTINGEGVAIFNYIGHGSPFKLSDENVLIDTDAGTFSNSSRLPLFVAASCDVGKFNDPRVPSLGERLLLSAQGGAMGVISATEIAYSDLNVDLAYQLYSAMYQRAVGSGQFQTGVAPSLLTAKLLTSDDAIHILNNEKYQLMGDAGLRVNLPKLWVEITLFDATGTTAVSQILGGQSITIRGRVVDKPVGGTLVPYTGIADLLIEDSQPRPTSPDCVQYPGCQRTQYDFEAGDIFRGDVAVTGGNFEGHFVVPIEARVGPRGKIRTYLQGLPGSVGATDAVGSIRMQVSPGTAPAGDNEGPTISLSFPGGVTSVRPDAVLRVDLSDPNGILTTGHTIQNGVVVTLDDNTTARIDVTESFRYAAGSYTTGTAYFTLPNLAAGSHTVKVSAADNLAAGLTAILHRSTAALPFSVVSLPPVQIRNAYLFPNPTESGRHTSGGQFVVDGPGDSVNVMIRVFTISGRLIRELTSFGQFGQVQVPWDGYDAEGYPLANGVYLFKVYVNGRDAKGRSSAKQEASTEGRIVILNH